MVNLLLALMLGPAFADTHLVGIRFDAMDVRAQSGNFDASFARANRLTIRDSRLTAFVAFKAAIARFELRDSAAGTLDASAALFEKSVWDHVEADSASFRQAKLRGARFQNAHFASCNFEEADLRDVTMEETRLESCTFKGARYNDNSVLPMDASAAESLGMIYDP